MMTSYMKCLVNCVCWLTTVCVYRCVCVWVGMCNYIYIYIYMNCDSQLRLKNIAHEESKNIELRIPLTSEDYCENNVTDFKIGIQSQINFTCHKSYRFLFFPMQNEINCTCDILWNDTWLFCGDQVGWYMGWDLMWGRAWVIRRYQGLYGRHKLHACSINSSKSGGKHLRGLKCRLRIVAGRQTEHP